MNSTGSDNTAVGQFALPVNTSGVANTAIGENAGLNNITGAGNTFLGANTSISGGGFTDATAVGGSAVVQNSYEIQLGDASASNGVYTVGNYFSTSDGRFKTNITENVIGLAFIKKLRPVTYNLDTKSLGNYTRQNLPDSIKKKFLNEQNYKSVPDIVHSGFIAQEVEKAAQDVGFTSSIVHTPVSNSDPYALSYSEIVVPLVKAMQELSGKLDSLTSVSANQNAMIKYLQNQINTIQQKK